MSIENEEGIDFFEFANRIECIYTSLTDTYYNKNTEELKNKAKIIIKDNKVILKIDSINILIDYY